MRMLLLLVSLILSAGIAAPVQAERAGHHQATSCSQKKEQIVYVTRTGHKYHRAGCRYLSRSKIPITLSEARLSYAPCKVCMPPR